MVRKHIYFTGVVQGVGYSYRACGFAASLGLTGWVTNLWDGRVELEVQGPHNVIEQMIEMLYQQRFIRIEKMETADRTVKEGEKSFRVR